MHIDKTFWLGVIFIFCLLFRPPILPIDLLIPMTFISAYGILREVLYKNIDFKNFFLSQSINKLVRLSALFAVLSFIGILIGILTESNYSITSSLNAAAKLVWTFWLYPINLIFLFIIFQKRNVQVNTILRMILYATMIQAVFAITSYLIPEIKNIFISIMQANNWSERWTDNNAAGQRMNGFAKSLFDTFGYGMGILSSVPFILSYRTNHLKYLLTLPFIFIAILVNARTGLVIFTIVLLIFTILMMKHRRKFSGQSSILAIIFILTIIPIGMHSIVTFMSSGSSFAMHTENDINSYIEFIKTGGKDIGSYGGQADILFSDKFWTIPSQSPQLLFGMGLSVYGKDSPYDFKSDVGYINNIWYFGLVGLVSLHAIVFRHVRKVTRHHSYWRSFATIAIVSILFFQIKGSAFWSANLGISATILLLAVCIYEQNLERKY